MACKGGRHNVRRWESGGLGMVYLLISGREGGCSLQTLVVGEESRKFLLDARGAGDASKKSPFELIIYFVQGIA